MALDIDNELKQLRAMTTTELRTRYRVVFGEDTRSFHKQFLLRRIAWQLQANEYGGLSERARQRAHELADERFLRTRAPKTLGPTDPERTVVRTFTSTHDRRLPMPGTLLTRHYRGRTLVVKVLDGAFEHDGNVYRSLTAIAKAVTGSHWNGFGFFGLLDERKDRSMKKRSNQPADATQKRPIRCAIYTRVSTDDGLKQDFNSLDAQRESAENFIAAFKHEGWVCLPDRYDDGGFSGGNMDRPGLTRLLADIEAGQIDCIVVYKLDRLSRSIVDFGRLVERLQGQGVDFRSVTEPVDTATATGRLVLNTLMSFAQHYREQIAERTRDKMRASRRKGKWVGGMQLLGYDVAPQGGRLIVNELEAARVRTIFGLCLDRQALIPTVEELNRRGWTTKQWITRDGRQHVGQPFDKARLHRLLTNRTYLGKVDHDGTIYPGEHEAILEEDVWQRTQELLRRNARTGGRVVRNKHGALLRGLLWCRLCESVMVHTYTKKGDSRLYRFYVCRRAQTQGWKGCPTKAVPAEEIERFVVDHIRVIGRDHDLQNQVLRQATEHIAQQVGDLERERTGLLRDLPRLRKNAIKLQTVRSPGPRSESAEARLADAQLRLAEAEQRLTSLTEQLRRIEADPIDGDDLRQVLLSFDPCWDVLTPKERARVIQLLVETVALDGAASKLSITFRPSGIRALCDEIRAAQEVPA